MMYPFHFSETPTCLLAPGYHYPKGREKKKMNVSHNVTHIYFATRSSVVRNEQASCLSNSQQLRTQLLLKFFLQLATIQKNFLNSQLKNDTTPTPGQNENHPYVCFGPPSPPPLVINLTNSLFFRYQFLAPPNIITYEPGNEEEKKSRDKTVRRSEERREQSEKNIKYYSSSSSSSTRSARSITGALPTPTQYTHSKRPYSINVAPTP